MSNNKEIAPLPITDILYLSCSTESHTGPHGEIESPIQWYFLSLVPYEIR